MESVYSDLSFLSLVLQDALATNVKVMSAQPVGGGEIHHSYRLDLNDGRCFFVKCNALNFAPLFQHEFYALGELAKSNALRIPKAYGYVERENIACLVMEWLDLQPSGNQALLGQQLAKLHNVSDRQFGWIADNYIGYSNQKNTASENWADFWRENRLRPQLDLAINSGIGEFLKYLVDDFYCASDSLLENHHPKAALLHGDLWGGNKSFLPSGEPVLFDPASYYGDAETDIAFTVLFGGFNRDFYCAYDNAVVVKTAEILGVSPQAYLHARQKRQHLYNTYHQLNHLNMFGDCYLPTCLSAIKKVITLSCAPATV